MKSKSYLLKFFALLFLLMILMSPSYGQRAGVAGRSRTDALATAHDQTALPGDKMGRSQLEQTCTGGNPTLASNAFLSITSYNNYLAICAEVKARLFPPNEKGRAGVTIPAAARDVVREQQTQDNLPVARPGRSDVLETLKPSAAVGG